MQKRREFLQLLSCLSLGTVVNQDVKAKPLQTASLRFGVTSTRSLDFAKSAWAPVAAKLGKKLNRTIEIVPLEISKVTQAVQEKKCDFVIANPVQAIYLHHYSDTRYVASIDGPFGPRFAGVILTLKNSKVKNLSDLRNQTVVAMGASSAGGYIFQAHHLKLMGLVAAQDYSILFARNQDDAIQLLNERRCAAAFVRTGLLETWAGEGKLKPNEFLVLDEKRSPEFPLRRTTDLYPEHFLLAASHLEREKIERFKTELLALSPSDPIFSDVGIRGFIEPVSNKALENVLRQLQLAPFDVS